MTYDSRNLTRAAAVLVCVTLLFCPQGLAQLTISITTDKRTYGYGEASMLTGTVTNQADSAVTVTQPYQGPVTQVFFDNVRLSWILLPTELPYVFGPHTSRSSVFQLDVSRLGLPN
ncbi:MAG: hypothetical protein V1799_18760 [bacterium]